MNVPGKSFIVIRNEKNLGCKNSYLNALSKITDECDFICTVDNDVHVKHNFISTFLNVYDDAFTIFNTHNMELSIGLGLVFAGAAIAAALGFSGSAIGMGHAGQAAAGVIEVL